MGRGARRVFVSYCKTSDDYQEIVVALAERLVKDGIDVVIDVWNLRPGYDRYSFVERQVADESIDKVLVLCDARYAIESDERKGMPGSSTALITPEVYGSAEQSKFIPVVMESDKCGRPCLPSYLRPRAYVDMSRGRLEEGYDELLCAIMDETLWERPNLGQASGLPAKRHGTGKDGVSQLSTEQSVDVAQDSIANEVGRYDSMFREDLFLDLGLRHKASVDKVFVTPQVGTMESEDFCDPLDVDLFDLLHAFFRGRISTAVGTLSDNVRAITLLGQPGSGKTTVVSAIVAHSKDIVPCGMRLFCFRLSKLADTDFFRSGHPLRYVCRGAGLGDSGFDDAVVLLDGLDELCMVLAAGATIDDFYESLLEDVHLFRNCRVLVTSRVNYVHGVFGRPNLSHVLQIMPFDEMRIHEFASNLEAAREMRIDESCIGSVLERYDEYDFLAVPFLLYVTLSLGLDVAHAEELGDLYDEIFSAIAERPYGDGRRHSATERFDAREVARALATEMRRKNRGYLDAREADDVLASMDFPLLPDDEYQHFTKLIEKGYGLTFFYRSKDSRAFAPEFYHRSFAEYLAAEQLVAKLGLAVERGEDGCHIWWEQMGYLLGGEEIQEEVSDYFSHLVRKEGKTEEYVDAMRRWFFESYLPEGMLSLSDAVDDMYDPVTKGLMLFINYWRLLKSLLPDSPVFAGDYLDDEYVQDFVYLLRLASRVKMQGMCFDAEDFGGFDLEDVDFSECSLIGTNLYGAVLSHCNFADADLAEANLGKALLNYTDLTGANLSEADLRGATVVNCNLREAMNCNPKGAKVSHSFV